MGSEPSATGRLGEVGKSIERNALLVLIFFVGFVENNKTQNVTYHNVQTVLVIFGQSFEKYAFTIRSFTTVSATTINIVFIFIVLRSKSDGYLKTWESKT